MSSTRRRSSRAVKEPIKPAVLAGLFILVMACTFLLYSGFKMMPASINYFQSTLFLQDWNKQKQEPSAKAFAIAHKAALKSAEGYPVVHGRYYAQLGHVLQWQDYSKPFGDLSAQGSRQQALAAHRQAVRARPTWPYSHLDVAWTKLYLFEIDAEFEEAMTQAERYGKSRIPISRGLAEISFFAWPRLNEQQRQRALTAAKRTVKLSPREGMILFSAAKQTGLTDELCHAVPKSLWGAHKVCLEKDV